MTSTCPTRDLVQDVIDVLDPPIDALLIGYPTTTSSAGHVTYCRVQHNIVEIFEEDLERLAQFEVLEVRSDDVSMQLLGVVRHPHKEVTHVLK